MACNCNKDDSLPGSDPATWTPKTTSSFDIMKWLPFILLLIALMWFFFLRSKGPHYNA